MISKIIDLSDGDSIDFMSLLDEFKIPLSEFDIRKLKVTFDEDWSGCCYLGEKPDLSLIVEYEDTQW